MPFPETGPFVGAIIILDHSAALYRYSPAMERYSMWDDRFDDFATYLDLDGFATIFNENFEKALLSGLSVISMPYTPVMAKVLEACLHKYFSSCLENWLCVSFFHNDDDTAKIPRERCENPLAHKASVLKGLRDFPYIKKITIPYNLLITDPSLYNLLENSL